MIFLLWRDFFKLCHKKSFLAQNIICAPFIGAITQKQGVQTRTEKPKRYAGNGKLRPDSRDQGATQDSHAGYPPD
jgi:hypothetical protein